MIFKQAQIIFRTTRPNFLLLPPVCVLLGYSTALTTGASIKTTDVLLILTGAILAHISVNMLNEYYDFKSGLDFKTQKTSFSGGSGALPSSPELANMVLIFGLVSLVLTIFIGLFFILELGMQILPIGFIGIVLIASYTPWLNRLPLICLISPGLGFGILMVVGTHVVLAGMNSILPWLVSLIPFFLINNLLLLNQYPDIKADASVGRQTFPIFYGLKTSNAVFAFFILATVSWILFLLVKDYLPMISIAALIPMLFSLYSLIGVNKYSSDISNYPKFMAANVLSSLLTPLFLGTSIILATHEVF
ncbi:MAG: prenyltransferase [Gammaproteobacteria bacterium]|nr:prenyltransferase [Gammaproteobacteria bacterium]